MCTQAKLLVELRAQRVEELSQLRGDLVAAAWGTQIRSTVLSPYKMVKDLRSGCETAQVQAVLDGELDGLIDAFLRWRQAEDSAARAGGGAEGGSYSRPPPRCSARAA